MLMFFFVFFLFVCLFFCFFVAKLSKIFDEIEDAKGCSKEIRFTVVEPVGTVPRRVRRTNGRKMVVCSTKRSGNGPHGL